MKVDRARVTDIVRRGCFRQSHPVTLPGSQFFFPTEKFRDWTRSLPKNALILDCGCGSGHLAKEFESNYIGIDVNEREDEVPMIVHMDAALFPFGPEHTVILARPNAGEWIDDTAYMALAGGARVFVATKKEYLIENWNHTEVAKDVGEDGETLWELTGD